MELLVAMTVSVIVLAPILAIINQVSRQWNRQVGLSRAVDVANLSLSLMDKELRSAVLYHATDGTKTCTFSLPANTDGSGHYVPAWSGGSLSFQSGVRVHYYLSDTTGTAGTGTVLWREYNPNPSGDAGWVQDASWSLLPGSNPAQGKLSGVSSLTFTTTGMPANTVRVTLTVADTENHQISTYSLQRDVYLSNHN